MSRIYPLRHYPFVSMKGWQGDGVAATVNFGNDPDELIYTQQEITVSLWIKGDGSGFSGRAVNSRSLNNSAFYLTDSQFQIELSGAGTPKITYTFPTDSQWHHVVGTLSGGTHLELWLDAVSQGTFTNPIAAGIIKNDTGSGLDWNYGLSLFDGILDEITWWQAGFTQADAVELFNLGRPLNPYRHSKADDLIIWHRMGEALEGTTIPDQIGNFDGELVNSSSDDIVEVYHGA